MNYIWFDYLDVTGKGNLNKRILDEMKDSPNWTINIKCKIMRLNEVLDAKLESRISKLRKRRNDLTHKVVKRRIRISKEESEEIYSVCKKLFTMIIEKD